MKKIKPVGPAFVLPFAVKTSSLGARRIVLDSLKTVLIDPGFVQSLYTRKTVHVASGGSIGKHFVTTLELKPDNELLVLVENTNSPQLKNEEKDFVCALIKGLFKENIVRTWRECKFGSQEIDVDNTDFFDLTGNKAVGDFFGSFILNIVGAEYIFVTINSLKRNVKPL